MPLIPSDSSRFQLCAWLDGYPSPSFVVDAISFMLSFRVTAFGATAISRIQIVAVLHQEKGNCESFYYPADHLHQAGTSLSHLTGASTHLRLVVIITREDAVCCDTTSLF